jgi:TIGR03009 family protein
MTRAGLALTVALAAFPAYAQVPQPPAGTPMPVGQPAGNRIPIPGADAPAGLPAGGLPQVDPKLLAHLTAWEAVQRGANNFYAEVTRTRKDMLLKKERVATGSVMCQKPNLARMRLETKPTAGQKPNPNDYEAYICTGKDIFLYDGMTTTVTAYPLRGNGVGDNLLLEFMSGMLKVNEVFQRFDLKFLQEDKHYIYLEITAKQPKDKAEFQTMILVLHRPDIPNKANLAYLPRTVVMRKNNGQEEETWDFPSPLINVKIDPSSFQYVQPPAGWKVQQAQAPATPGTPPGSGPGIPVARPKGP